MRGFSQSRENTCFRAYERRRKGALRAYLYLARAFLVCVDNSEYDESVLLSTLGPEVFSLRIICSFRNTQNEVRIFDRSLLRGSVLVHMRSLASIVNSLWGQA